MLELTRRNLACLGDYASLKCATGFRVRGEVTITNNTDTTIRNARGNLFTRPHIDVWVIRRKRS